MAQTLPTNLTEFQDGEVPERDGDQPGLKVETKDDSHRVQRKVRHRFGSAGASFDGIDFTGSHGEAFAKILDQFDLGREPTVVEMYPENDSSVRYYVWHNQRVLIVCGNNPLTGETGKEIMASREKGHAHYVGIEGERTTVDAVRKELAKRATFYEAVDKTQRSYI